MPKHEPGAVDFAGEDNSGDAGLAGTEKQSTDIERSDGVSRAEGQPQTSSSAVYQTDMREPIDFAHPAAVEPQRIIWLARDSLGLAGAEARTLNSEGVETSTAHAVMDENGNVTIDGAPPGEDPAAIA